MLPGASPTLRDRLLGKIVMAGPATPCAVWVGAYNRPGRYSGKRSKHHRRPVIKAGGRASSVLYVAPTLLQLAAIAPAHPAQRQALHTCPTGPAWHGMFACVDLDHLRWGTQAENEADKRA